MATNLHALPPSNRAEALRQRRAVVARAKTRAQTSRTARRNNAAKPPSGARMTYARGLSKLVRHMWNMILDAHGIRHDDIRSKSLVTNELKVTLYKLADGSSPMIQGVARQVSDHNSREMKRLIGIDPRIDPGVGAAAESFLKDNVRLIKSIADDQLDRVEKVLNENFGLRVEDLAEKLEEQFGVTESRALLIARDQTLTQNAQLTQIRQQNAGIEEYIWTIADRERVRPEHEELDGKRFRWDVGHPTEGHPGTAINCRCSPYPIVPGLEDF